MALTVTLTPRAAADIAHIRDYLLARNPQAADNVRLAIGSTLTVLSDYPLAGRDRPELEVRSIGVPRYPYTIYYCVQGAEILIVHVRDDRRSPLAAGTL